MKSCLSLRFNLFLPSKKLSWINKEDFEIIGDGDEPIETPKQLDFKEQRMVNTKDIARKMEEDRKRSLGYDEDKLPKG